MGTVRGVPMPGHREPSPLSHLLLIAVGIVEGLVLHLRQPGGEEGTVFFSEGMGQDFIDVFGGEFQMREVARGNQDIGSQRDRIFERGD